MRHWYYLHTNGSLIHKPTAVTETDPAYFDSPFVRRVWQIETTSRATCWRMLLEARALGAAGFLRVEVGVDPQEFYDALAACGKCLPGEAVDRIRRFLARKQVTG